MHKYRVILQERPGETFYVEAPRVEVNSHGHVMFFTQEAHVISIFRNPLAVLRVEKDIEAK